MEKKLEHYQGVRMTKKMELYKCERCGNIAEIVHRSGIPLVCCGIKMGLLEVKTADASTEKHVPVIEKIDGGYKVTIGSTPHPMTEEHYIELIDLIAGNRVYREFLEPGAPAEAFFYVEAEDVQARELCNVHGLWKA